MRLIRQTLLLMLVLCLVSVSAKSQMSVKPKKDKGVKARHCVVNVEPVKQGEDRSKISDPVCYDSLEKAKASISGQPILGTDYQGANYTEWTITWTGTYGNCTSLVFYVVFTMPTGWNNVISSTKGNSGSGCTLNTLYDGTPAFSAKRDCRPSCSTLGTMDNKTSSRAFYH
jgi:hypothetical protein